MSMLFPAPIIVQQHGRMTVQGLANGAVNQGTTQFVAHVQQG